jgi:hypothetical protein
MNREVAIVLIVAASLATPAPSQTHLLLTHESEQKAFFLNDAYFLLPPWEAGGLLALDGNHTDDPVIVRVDRDALVERIGLSFPEGRYLFVSDLAGASDGTIAAAGASLSNDGRIESFLIRIGRDRDQKTVWRLQPYVPHAVTIVPGGGFCTVGWVRNGADEPTQYNVMKRYDSSGKLLTTSVVKAKSKFGRDATTNSMLRSSNDRIGWLTNGNEYIEFDLDGHELGRYPPPPGSTSKPFSNMIAMSEKSEVLAAARDGVSLKISWLDRPNGVWHAVGLSGPQPLGATIMGSMATRLSSSVR